MMVDGMASEHDVPRQDRCLDVLPLPTANDVALCTTGA